MPCYHPLKAWVKGTKPNGKYNIVKITGQDVDQIVVDGIVYPEFALQTIDVGCGQCIGCRMEYSRQWANRLMLELQDHKADECFFVTLTYDDDHIADHCLSGFADQDTGELKGYSLSLRKRDFQLFMKRLRKAVEPVKIRFFAVGEYGGKTFRPHFHLILFGLPLPSDDLKFYKKSELGYNYFNSDLLARCWPFGFNVVAPVTWESCCYTARYMLKKQKGENAHVYDDFGLEAPFSLCSRKPGLARGYYDRCEDFSKVSSIVIGTDRGSRKFPPPKYLEKLFEFDEPEEALKRRKIRQLSALNREKIVLSRTNLSKTDYYDLLEKNIEKASQVLYNFRCLV